VSQAINALSSGPQNNHRAVVQRHPPAQIATGNSDVMRRARLAMASSMHSAVYQSYAFSVFDQDPPRLLNLARRWGKGGINRGDLLRMNCRLTREASLNGAIDFIEEERALAQVEERRIPPIEIRFGGHRDKHRTRIKQVLVRISTSQAG
jgi:hypothetical protein